MNLKPSILALSLLLCASPALASGFCRQAPFDPELPAGLEGRYEIIGRHASSGDPYSGRLDIGIGESGYTVQRSVDGTVATGRAWIEHCGADRIPFLVVQYTTRPQERASCRLGTDGDNHYRVTCRTSDGEPAWRGLEAWFQQQGSDPGP